MSSFSAFLPLLFGITVGYEDGDLWKLAFNINPDDGHNFGYEANAWEDDTDVGNDANAFMKDYKNYDVTLEIANFIAIVRHQNGTCEAARVWELLTPGKTLNEYLDTKKTSRLMATYDNYTYSYISPTMVNKDEDPIFAVDGGLTFNWWYSNNGVRVGNSKTYIWGKDLPGETINDDSYHGLGNEFARGDGNGYYWFDVGVHQGSCLGGGCKVQGSDHGTRLNDGTTYGQYAIYTSDLAETFDCKGFDLEISVSPKWLEDFHSVDRSYDGFLNFDEFVFNIADRNRDGVLSFLEYTAARREKDFSKTATETDFKTDFKRIDKDNNALLTFNEILFDAIDSDKDGLLSTEEYSQARSGEELLRRRSTYYVDF